MKHKIIEITWEFEKKTIIQKFIGVEGYLFPVQISKDFMHIENIKDKTIVGEVEFTPPSRPKSGGKEIKFSGGFW